MSDTDPLTGELLAKPKTLPPEKPQDALDLSRLDGMTRDELIALVRRVCGARWGEIAGMSKDERMESAKLKLWHEGLTSKEIVKYLPALREAMDRETGKPSQSIAMTVESKGLDKLSDERLLRLESALARMTGEEAIVIPPEPKKLDMVGSDN